MLYSSIGFENDMLVFVICSLAIRNQIIPHAALWYKHEEENCVQDDETIIPWAEGWYEYVIDDCRPEDHAVILTW